jgi:hypothetical protein
MKNKQAVILAPFDPPGRRVFDTAARALRGLGVFVVMPSDNPSGDSLTVNIAEAIRDSDLVVADVTRGNPYVLYELGVAHALRRPTIILLDTDASAKLPIDFSGQPFIPYTEGQLGALGNAVTKAAKRALQGSQR